MVAEFVQALSLIFSIGVVSAVFYLLATKWQEIRPPVAVFLAFVGFLSLSLSALSARMYLPIVRNGTVVYVQDAYGVGFISSLLSTFALFISLGLLIMSVANEWRRVARR